MIFRISSYCFSGNYSFLSMEIQRSQYIRPKVTVHKGAETIQGRKLFKGGNYIRNTIIFGRRLLVLQTRFSKTNICDDFLKLCCAFLLFWISVLEKVIVIIQWEKSPGLFGLTRFCMYISPTGCSFRNYFTQLESPMT